MKNQFLKLTPLLLLMILTLSSCEAIGTIFKTGFNIGVFVVILAIVIIAVVFRRLKK